MNPTPFVVLLAWQVGCIADTVPAQVDPLADFTGLPPCDRVLDEVGGTETPIDLGELVDGMTVCGTLPITGHEGDEFTGDVDAVRVSVGLPREVTVTLSYLGTSQVHLHARDQDGALLEAVGGPDAFPVVTRPIQGEPLDFIVAVYEGEPVAYALSIGIEEVVVTDRVYSGGDTSCVIQDSGLLCWGEEATERMEEAPSRSWAAIAVAENYICGLDTEGGIACWGSDAVSQPPEGAFTAVTADRYGGCHLACALRATGEVECWGNINTCDLDVPDQLFHRVSSGYGFSCGIDTEAALACWGAEADAVTPVPTGTFREVIAGPRYACALPADAVGVVCWGDDTYGSWKEGKITAPPTSGTYSQLAAGWHRACARGAYGALTCWGWEPEIEVLPAGASVHDVSAGQRHTCIVRDDGVIFCWGTGYGEGVADAP